MPLVVFRVDGGTSIGAGHVMRCIAQSEHFLTGGWKVGFAARAETFRSIAALSGGALEKLEISGDDDRAARLLAERWPLGADVLVADHYGLDAVFERACRPWAKRILVIDDLANRAHDADVLVDTARSPESYSGLVSPHCNVLTGTRYAILHPNFRRMRAAALDRREWRRVDRIVLGFGQIDSPNVTMQALEALDDSGFRGEVDVLLGGSAPHLEEVRATAKGRVHLHVDSKDIPTLIAYADLAIGAGGMSAWERCCLGLPSLLVEIADNQRDTISFLVRAGAAAHVDTAGASLKSRLKAGLVELLEDGDRREAMSRSGAELVDGRGGDRVMLAAIEPAFASSENAVTLRLAELADEEWLHDLQRHPETRRFANDRSAPTRERHHDWFAGTLADAARMLAIVECDGSPAGMLRLDWSGETARVSIAVAPGFHRMGIGSAALELAARVAPNRVLEAEILPGNDASLALFERAGYRQVEKTLFKRVP